MKTTAATTAIAMNGIMTLKTWSGLFHRLQAARQAHLDAKIISEIPLPMPRWVSSPIP
jgi:hypothetical protein